MHRYEVGQVRGRLIDIGPQLLITLGPSIPERNAAAKQGKSLKDPQPVRALIDTGARLTIITPETASRCGLVQVSTTKIFVVGGGEVPGPVYSAQMAFPDSPLASWPAIQIVGADLHHREIECLIGRDILRRWIMEYDGPSGQLIISEHD